MKKTKHRASLGFGPKKRSRTVVVLLPESISEAVKIYGKKTCLEMIHQQRVIEVQRIVRQKMDAQGKKRIVRALKSLKPKDLKKLLAWHNKK